MSHHDHSAAPSMGHDHHQHMGHGDMSHDDQMKVGHMGMMHSMAFHFGYSETILFESWQVDSITGFVSSLVGIFFAALVYEGLKYFREYLFWKNYNAMHYQTVQNGGAPEIKRDDVPQQNINFVEEIVRRPPPTMFSSHHAIQTILHLIQMTVSYLLMLIFMTFNVWLCAGVILGSATGYFLFGWKKALFVDITEHCH